MLCYCARRGFSGIIVLIALSAAVFTMMYMAPGSMETTLLGKAPRSPEAIMAVRQEYHLDQPVWKQYCIWLGRCMRGDFGNSITYRAPTIDVIGRAAVLTAELGVLAFGLAVIVGMGLGVASALHARTPMDRVMVGASVIGTSTPTFILGVLLMYAFAIALGWFPVSGPGRGGLDRMSHLVLPALALGFSCFAEVLKLTRAGVLNNVEQDSYLFARARGVHGWLLIRRYALRGGLIPLVTGLALLLMYLLTGAVLVEVAFGLPGVASLLVDAVNTKDVPVLQALTLLTGAIVIILNLVADISYHFIDPRVRIGEMAR